MLQPSGQAMKKHSEVNNIFAECGSTSLSRGHEQGRFQRTPLKKIRRNKRSVATRVSQRRSSGASQKECGFRLQCPNNAPRVQCIWESFKGEFRKKSSVNGPFERLQEAYHKVVRRIIAPLSALFVRGTGHQKGPSVRKHPRDQ